MAGELDFRFLDIYARCALEDLNDGSVAPSLEDLSRSFSAIGECEGNDLIEAREFDLLLQQMISK